ncbi:MAG: hypothetical protein RMM58_02275 [Chloroflexota bacterium]|nr:hypothetical protein [Dehalococcoidia bacterium]MDW8252683.1 hypothetical protein [Chloroflexota bacterium]
MPPQTARRAAVALVLYALGRWQTAVVVLVACAGIAATILFFDSQPVLLGVWLGFGLIGAAAMVLATFRDERAVEEALAPVLDLRRLRTRELREAVQRAQEYREAIRQAVAAAPRPELRASLEMITAQFDNPAALILELGVSIERFRHDRLIQRDLARLRAQQRAGRLSEHDRAHLDNLLRLERLVAEAEQKIQAMLAQLGSSYAEVQMIGATREIRGGRMEQALDEVADRAAELSQLRRALEEAYASTP